MGPDLSAGTPVAGRPLRPDYLELPRPWRLMVTAGWNLAESFGLPVAGYFVGAKLGGQEAGMVTATAVVWLTVAIRKIATRSVPGLLTISAQVLTLQTAMVIVTGSVLFFLLQFPLADLALCVLFARTAPTRKPLVAQLAAEMVALRQPSSHHPGLDRFFQRATWLWAGIFALSTVGLAVLMAIESVQVFLLLTTASPWRHGRGHLLVHPLVHPGCAPFRPPHPLHPGLTLYLWTGKARAKHEDQDRGSGSAHVSRHPEQARTPVEGPL